MRYVQFLDAFFTTKNFDNSKKITDYDIRMQSEKLSEQLKKYYHITMLHNFTRQKHYAKH
jgi:hypothetical protein